MLLIRYAGLLGSKSRRNFDGSRACSNPRALPAVPSAQDHECYHRYGARKGAFINYVTSLVVRAVFRSQSFVGIEMVQELVLPISSSYRVHKEPTIFCEAELPTEPEFSWYVKKRSFYGVVLRKNVGL